MKQIFLILIIIFPLFLFSNANAAELTVENNGEVQISESLIEQPIKVSFSALLYIYTTLSIISLDENITNLNDGTVIPLSKLFIVDEDSNSYSISSTQDTVIAQGTAVFFDKKTRYFKLQIQNPNALTPGTYSLRLRFNIKGLMLSEQALYTLSFTIPTTQNISSDTPIQINLTSDDVFNSTTISNIGNPTLKIQSNTNWRLTLDTTNIGDLIGDYYFQIINVDDYVKSYEVNQIKLEQNQIYNLAQGIKTINTFDNNLDTSSIYIKFLLKNKDDSYFREGNYLNNVRYILEEN